MAMTTARTQEILMAYAQALLGRGDFGQYMGEDVAYTIMNSGRAVRGREATVRAIIESRNAAGTTSAVRPPG